MTIRRSQTGISILLFIIAAEVAFLLASSGPAKQTNEPAGPPRSSASLQLIDHADERAFWADRIDAVGAEAAYTEFKLAYESDDFGLQHTLAHLFGELLYDTTGVAGVAVCDSTFAFGCYHSFFGKAIATEGIGIIKQMDAACEAKWGAKGLGCPHGIGHGVLSYLGEENLLESLEKCRTLSWQEPIGGCTSGVFMEYNFRTMEDPDGTQARPYDPAAPHYPCSVLPETFLEACYWDLPQWWEQVLDHDYPTIGALCAEVRNELAEDACYRGLGNAIAPSTHYDIAETIERCKQMPTFDGEVLCREGASWSFYAEPKVRSLAPKVCEFKDAGVTNRCTQNSDIYDDIP